MNKDFCNLKSYTKEGIASLLEAHQVNVSNNDRFVLYLPTVDINMHCYKNSYPVNDVFDKYILTYTSLYGAYLQLTGCVGMIMSRTSIGFTANGLYLGQDVESQTVFGNRWEPNITMHYHLSESVDKNVFYTRMKRARLRGESVELLSITTGRSWADEIGYEIMENTWSLYRILGAIDVVTSLAGCFYGLKVMGSYFFIQKGKLPADYCTFALIFSILSAVIRFVSAFDMLGYYKVYHTLVCRTMYTLHVTLSITSSMGNLFAVSLKPSTLDTNFKPSSLFTTTTTALKQKEQPYNSFSF
jgi:hypothetical protein